MVYFITDGIFTKIGVTQHIEARLVELQVGNARTLSVIRVFPGEFELERKAHSLFKPYRVKGEWFDIPAHLLKVTLEEIEGVEVKDDKFFESTPASQAFITIPEQDKALFIKEHTHAFTYSQASKVGTTFGMDNVHIIGNTIIIEDTQISISLDVSKKHNTSFAVIKAVLMDKLSHYNKAKVDFTDIVELTGISLSTIHRTVPLLIKEGFITKHMNGIYQLK